MSIITPSGLERLLFVCAVAATIHGAAVTANAVTALAAQRNPFLLFISKMRGC